MLRKAVLAFSLVLSFCAINAAFAAEMQQSGAKVARIGFLSPGSAAVLRAAPGGLFFGGTGGEPLKAFMQRLREDGWIEGQNLVIEYRGAEGKYERLPELAAELVRLKVDLIFASGAPAAVAAKRTTSTLPIVFWTLGDAVSAGLITSLARPAGNLTGISGLGSELAGKRLELLRELIPGLRQAAILVNPTNVVTVSTVREMELAARSLGIRLQVVEVRERSGLDAAFAAINRERSQALVVQADAVFSSEWQSVVAAVNASRLPTIFVETGWVQSGGLMSYSQSLVDTFQRAAGYVDKILRGAKPTDLPIEQATKFELVINLKTAKALGLTIPQSLLLRADEVIQ